MSIRVRRLRRGDATWVRRADPLFDDPADPGAAAAYLRDPANVFFLALDGAEPVGFLRGTALRQVSTATRQMFLYEIAVAPAYHRRGIGRRLIERFLRLCRQRHYDEAFVFTDPGNDAAVGLYRSTGAVTETPADRMFVYRMGSPDGRRPPHGRPRPSRPRASRRRRRRIVK